MCTGLQFTCISERRDSTVIRCWFSSSLNISLSWRHSSSSAEDTWVSGELPPTVPSFRLAISLSFDWKYDTTKTCVLCATVSFNRVSRIERNRLNFSAAHLQDSGSFLLVVTQFSPCVFKLGLGSFQLCVHFSDSRSLVR